MVIKPYKDKALLTLATKQAFVSNFSEWQDNFVKQPVDREAIESANRKAALLEALKGLGAGSLLGLAYGVKLKGKPILDAITAGNAISPKMVEDTFKSILPLMFATGGLGSLFKGIRGYIDGPKNEMRRQFDSAIVDSFTRQY